MSVKVMVTVALQDASVEYQRGVRRQTARGGAHGVSIGLQGQLDRYG